jgi:hypothetical protein
MDIGHLVGKTLCSATLSPLKHKVVFVTEDGEPFVMDHRQQCCETVTVEDIVGDLDDLVGSPILKAEASTNLSDPHGPGTDPSFTWTFYLLATVKGYVTIRWYGESNGYYSERVDFGWLEGCAPPLGAQVQLKIRGTGQCESVTRTAGGPAYAPNPYWASDPFVVVGWRLPVQFPDGGDDLIDRLCREPSAAAAAAIAALDVASLLPHGHLAWPWVEAIWHRLSDTVAPPVDSDRVRQRLLGAGALMRTDSAACVAIHPVIAANLLRRRSEAGNTSLRDELQQLVLRRIDHLNGKMGQAPGGKPSGWEARCIEAFVLEEFDSDLPQRMVWAARADLSANWELPTSLSYRSRFRIKYSMAHVLSGFMSLKEAKLETDRERKLYTGEQLVGFYQRHVEWEPEDDDLKLILQLAKRLRDHGAC